MYYFIIFIFFQPFQKHFHVFTCNSWLSMSLWSLIYYIFLMFHLIICKMRKCWYIIKVLCSSKVAYNICRGHNSFGLINIASVFIKNLCMIVRPFLKWYIWFQTFKWNYAIFYDLHISNFHFLFLYLLGKEITLTLLWLWLYHPRVE